MSSGTIIYLIEQIQIIYFISFSNSSNEMQSSGFKFFRGDLDPSVTFGLATEGYPEAA